MNHVGRLAGHLFKVALSTGAAGIHVQFVMLGRSGKPYVLN